MDRFTGTNWAFFKLVSCLLVIFKTELASAGCCTSKVVSSGSSDLRDGTYSLNGTSYNLPVFCKDTCVYTKDGTTPDDLYCFGEGDLDSECFAPLPEPTVPQGPPLEGGGAGGGEVAPPGGYYYNKLPGMETRALTCGEAISLVTEDRSTRLDLADQSQDVPSSYNVWSSSKLRFDRIDGESTGDVQFDHLVGIFATADNGAIFRLDVKAPTVPSTTAATARLIVTSGDGTACSGNVQYGTEYALLSEDGTKRLDIGTEGAGTPTTWDEANTNTRLHANVLP